MNTDRKSALASVAETIGDYRSGDQPVRGPDSVDRWVRQFGSDVQLPLLRELDHVLKSTYFSRARVRKFMATLARTTELTGSDPRAFWMRANFLRIQQNGASQREMLSILDEVLQEEFKLEVAECGGKDGPYIYLDDGLFTGSRLGNDVSAWVATECPPACTLHVIAIVTHAFGEYKAPERMKESARAYGKRLDLKLWRAVCFENRRAHRDTSEVLWPAVLPDDAALKEYMKDQGRFPFEPRRVGGRLEHQIFSSEDGRQLLERELLIAGVRIRAACQSPSSIIRPLGFSPFGLGFGALTVTFRNCPNNCPLALWWGDPRMGASHPLGRWYPLFPRKTYVREGAGVDDEDEYDVEF